MNVNGINNGSYLPVQKRESPKTGNTAPGFQNSFNGVHTLVMGGLCSRGLADGGCVTVYKAEGYRAEKGTESFSTAFAEKKNFYAIAEEMMKMQYECHNLAGYASYQKILSAFDGFMDKG